MRACTRAAIDDGLDIRGLKRFAVKAAAAESINDDQKRALMVSLAACEALAGLRVHQTSFTNYAEAEGCSLLIDVGARTRLYLRGKAEQLEFPEEYLNDADIWSAVVGLDGLLMTKKIRYDINGGYKNWDADNNGLIGDDNDYEDWIAWAQIVYQPWEDRKLSFQLEGGRDVDWSAISNYRIDDRIFFSIRDDLMPNRLAYDITLQVSHHEQSEGPRWDRLEAGAGLTWTPHRQFTVTLRYLYRNQDSDEDYEIVNTQASNTLNQEISTNGNFVQHVVSMGFEVRF